MNEVDKTPPQPTSNLEITRVGLIRAYELSQAVARIAPSASVYDPEPEGEATTA